MTPGWLTSSRPNQTGTGCMARTAASISACMNGNGTAASRVRARKSRSKA